MKRGFHEDVHSYLPELADSCLGLRCIEACLGPLETSQALFVHQSLLVMGQRASSGELWAMSENVNGD